MIDLPISENIKGHYIKHNVSFTDAQKATIIWQSRLSLTERLNSLSEILNSTTDEQLKSQIQRRLDHENGILRHFFKEDHHDIHEVYLDHEYHSAQVFRSLTEAINYGKENCKESFQICEETSDQHTNSSHNTSIGVTVDFLKDGAIISCFYYGSEEDDENCLHMSESNSFEEAYFPVLNPFDRGDIVRIIGDKRPAIVMTSQEDWNKFQEHIKQFTYPPTYDTNSVTVEFLYPDGEFHHGHPNILYLEKLEHWDNEETWQFIQKVSERIKRMDSLNNIKDAIID